MIAVALETMNLHEINEWCKTTFRGDWGWCNATCYDSTWRVVGFFHDSTDAMHFKLRWG